MKRLLGKLMGICCCFIGVFMVIFGISAMDVQAHTIGDVNKDFNINATDALMVLEEVAGIKELDRSEKLFADVNYDNVINADDALKILQVAVGETQFSYMIQVFTGEPQTISFIADSYDNYWEYETDTTTGFVVEKVLITDTGYEKVYDYVITGKERGLYELVLTNKDAATHEVLETKYYTIWVVDAVAVKMYEGEVYQLNLADTKEAYWSYDGNIDCEGLKVDCIQTDVVPANNYFYVTAKEAGPISYVLRLTLRNRENPSEILQTRGYVFKIYPTTVELNVGESVEFDNIRDRGAYFWEYEVNTETGITVERDRIEEPFDGRVGEWYEQVYTITANEPGTYTVTLKLTHAGTDDDIIETKVFTIIVK